jgi:hypothetical protein
MCRTLARGFAPLLLSSFLLAGVAAPARAEAPGKPGLGGQVFGNGRYRPAAGAVVFAVPGDPGFWAPNSRDNHNDVRSWDQVISILKRYPDRSVAQLVLSGHGDAEGGVTDGSVRLNYPSLTEGQAAVIRAKLTRGAEVVLLGVRRPAATTATVWPRSSGEP